MSNVISFEIKREEFYRRKCLHRRLYVLEETHMLECQDCGEKIDAYKYIWNLAREQEKAEYKIKSLRKELDKLKEKTKVKCIHCNQFTPIDKRIF